MDCRMRGVLERVPQGVREGPRHSAQLRNTLVPQSLAASLIQKASEVSNRELFFQTSISDFFFLYH